MSTRVSNGPLQIGKAIVFLLLLFLGAFLGTGFYHAILSVGFLFSPILYKKMTDSLATSWMTFCAGLLELFLGVKVKVTGDIMQAGERSLILMNHRTRLDWMYFWSVLVRQSGTTTEKIVLKSPLKSIPGFGWAMQVSSFIFIERKWDEDKKIFKKMIDYFVALKHKTQLLLFPEGTDLTDRTKAKSDEFAKKNNVEPYKYVLHPRTTGFTFLTQYMRQRGHLDAVYDVTIAYPQNIPQKEIDILTGNFPREVHFHVKRHVVQSLPISEEGLASWCKTRWEEKEQRLKTFYEEKAFDPMDRNENTKMNGNANLVTSEGDASSRWVESEEDTTTRLKGERKAKIVMQIMTVTWITFVAIILCILYTSSMARWLVFAEVCMFVIVTKRYGGFEFLQADYFNWFHKTNNTNKVKKVG